MISHNTTIRVRYSETDRMGYVYYGNYPQYYEVGRVETMRKFGAPYKMLEDSGILLPVANMNIDYIKPAYYDEELIVKTVIPNMPGVKFPFEYEIFNKNQEMINKGSTILVFVDRDTMKPCRIPDFLKEKVEPYFS